MKTEFSVCVCLWEDGFPFANLLLFLQKQFQLGPVDHLLAQL